MKSLKYALIAVLVACTTLAMATSDGVKPKPKKIVNITFQQAIHKPTLVVAMRAQLDPGFLQIEKQIYYVRVYDHGINYRIAGTRAQWIRFFGLHLKQAKDVKNVKLGTR